MTKKTSQLEKKTFVGLVVKKFADMRSFKSTIKKIENKSGLDLQYKTAQRYAREWLFYQNGSKEKFYEELYELMKQQSDAPVEVISEAEAPVAKATSPVKPVEGAIPSSSLWAVPEAESYLKIAGWLYAIDNGTINGSAKEARQFITTLDDYADKLQALLVNQTKEQLKKLLQQVKECEAVLDKSEVEDIWLEVGTEKSELVVTPYSREVVSPVLNSTSTVETV